MAYVNKGATRVGDNVMTQVSLPALVLHQKALEHNLRWMQNYADAHRALLAPHGKTTMTPALFQRQLKQGAWGITLATAVQSSVAYDHGVRRILMANQLVGEPNMAIIAGLLRQGGLEFHCLVENPDNVRALARYFSAQDLQLNVMLEIGVAQGRCGCRTPEQIAAVLAAIKDSPALALTGIEGYEGVIHGDQPDRDIQQFAAYLVETAVLLQKQGLFDIPRPYVTASGSAWYDVIAEAFAHLQTSTLFTPLLRPGCYLVHDHGLYKNAQLGVLQRHSDMVTALQPAMEVWAQVQSLPESGCAIIALGKRDIAFDAGYPEPLRHYSAGTTSPEPQILDESYRVTAMMDQHAFLHIPDTHALQVGDIIAFGASHPCLTFDKWRQVSLVDDALNVVEVMPTYF
ncbi:amino acid deaminase [Pectobacterium sp. B2J-2]|uniref:amino acid deaminase n=1 Tax=Pectobacterium sp. B2J-2 TaxID=3385372 RepID=UPI0038FCAD4C